MIDELKSKSIKINLIISDLSKDHLSFNRDFNEFNVDINELIENLNEDMIIIGELKASLRINKDLNQLVKYLFYFANKKFNLTFKRKTFG